MKEFNISYPILLEVEGGKIQWGAELFLKSSDSLFPTKTTKVHLLKFTAFQRELFYPTKDPQYNLNVS